MVLHQHKAAQFGSEVAFNPLWQRSQDRPAIGRDPAFALVTGRVHRNHEVLHQKGFITLEARPRRNLGRDHFLFNDDPRRDFVPATSELLFICRFWRLGAFVHAARFNIWATLRPFRRAISSRSSTTVCVRVATLPNSSTSRASTSGRLSAERAGGGST